MNSQRRQSFRTLAQSPQHRVPSSLREFPFAARRSEAQSLEHSNASCQDTGDTDDSADHGAEAELVPLSAGGAG